MMTAHPTTWFSLRFLGSDTRRGFSMIEIVLAIALMTVVAMQTIPSGLRFFEMQTLDESATTFRATLRTAQHNASSGLGGSAAGVALFPDSYVLFEGSSYVERDPLRDTTIPIEGDVTIVGPSEIVFAGISGYPDVAAEYIFESPHVDQIVLVVAGNGLTTFE